MCKRHVFLLSSTTLLLCGIPRYLFPLPKRLLTGSELTFTKEVEIDQSQETAAKVAQELVNDPDAGRSNVRRVSSESGVSVVVGEPTNSAECRFKGVSCFNCGKNGHSKSACRSPKKPQDTHTQPQRGKSGSK